jgi:hypothetical protein
MCLACEEQEYFFRVWCVDFLARGEMPPGVTMEDLEAMGLPPPNPNAPRGQSGEAKPEPAKPADSASNAFVCDSPDE